MKSIIIDGNVIEYIQKRSDRKTISATVNNNGVLDIRTPRWVNDQNVRQFILKNGARIIKMLDRNKQRMEYEDKLGEKGLEELKKQAETTIPERVKYFSKVMGVTPNRVRINTAKTRYGSCSAKGNLNFSCRMMAYSANAVDYVVVHELAHLIHMNHSSAFWRTVEKYMPEFRVAREELKGIPKI